MRIRGPWWGILILAVTIVVFRQVTKAPHPDDFKRNEHASSPRARTESSFIPGDPSPAEKMAGKVIEADWKELLQWLDSDPRPSESEIRKRLLELRSKWAEMEPTLLAETIKRLLESKDDQITGMKFRVGLHGFLEGWPTLRVFLLDALVTSDPEKSREIARSILKQTTSPDEFAVAMRSLTRDNITKTPETELLTNLQHLLDTPDWQGSGGFAESLDLARTIGTREAAGTLLAWEGNPELKSMALHEFAADHPREMMAALNSASEVDPLVRANLMARLDPADPDQMTALDGYLKDPARGKDDAAVFLKSFPLRSATTGNRLYARSPAPYHMDQIAAGDRGGIEPRQRLDRGSGFGKSAPRTDPAPEAPGRMGRSGEIVGLLIPLAATGFQR